jgi:hypothetical protein
MPNRICQGIRDSGETQTWIEANYTYTRLLY